MNNWILTKIRAKKNSTMLVRYKRWEKKSHEVFMEGQLKTMQSIADYGKLTTKL